MLAAIVSPVAYGTAVALAAALCAALCTGARRRPGPWVRLARTALGGLLLCDATSWLARVVSAPGFSPRTSLPLALCNIALLVAALACLWPKHVLVELTYFWGLTGTTQAVITPDLSVRFPRLEFFQYLVAHLGVVVAALFLVVGVRITPRRHAVSRTFAITVGYSALVAAVDYATGANYMFLRRAPGNWTLLRLLGPWPWYLLSATGLALALFALLNAPFWLARRNPPGHSPAPGSRPPDRLRPAA